MKTSAYDRQIGELRRRALVPVEVGCVLLVGSVARGWSNANSDVDLILVSGDAATVPRTSRWRNVPLHPDVVYSEATYVDGQRFDLEYWLDTQVDQMIDKACQDVTELYGHNYEQLQPREIDFLERLMHALPLVGPDWLAKRIRQLDNSALSSIATSRSLYHAHLLVEDAVGQLRAGDMESALLSAKLAFSRAVDGLLASHGEYGQRPKWRARRLRAVQQDVISYDRFWAIETMRDFDPERPGRWVESVIASCRRIMSKTRI